MLLVPTWQARTPAGPGGAGQDTPPGAGVQRLVPASQGADGFGAAGEDLPSQSSPRPGQGKDRLAVPGMQPPGREDRCAPGPPAARRPWQRARYGAATGAGQKLNLAGPLVLRARSGERGHPRPPLGAGGQRPGDPERGAPALAPAPARRRARQLPAQRLRRARPGRAAARLPGAAGVALNAGAVLSRLLTGAPGGWRCPCWPARAGAG